MIITQTSGISTYVECNEQAYSKDKDVDNGLKLR